MTSRRALGVISAVVLAVAGPPAVDSRVNGQQQPAFRAAGDLVSVDVSVHSGGTAVAGLTADDFVLLDNGVRQRVQNVEPAAMPLDVTILADVSGDTRGVWANGFSSEVTRAQVTKDVHDIGTSLRPEDRLRLLAIDTYVQQVFPFQPGGGARVGPVETAGLSSTYDGLVAALTHASEPNRRHLVIAWVKELDSISANEAQAVREVARRTDAVVHVVQRAVARLGPAPRAGLDATSIDIDVRTWHPFLRHDATLLTDLATATGGTLISPWGLQDANVADTFKDIFDTFRKGQVLHYAPQGVPREGVHTISVTVPRFPSAEIRARRTYFIEGPAGAAPGRSAPAAARPGSSPRAVALANLVAAFERSHDAFSTLARQTTDVRGVIREFVDSRPLSASPTRASVFALELATLGVGSRDEATRDDALDLLFAFHDLVRDPIEPDAFECGWYGAEADALLIGFNTGAADRAVTHALERCPLDGQLALARAIAADQYLSTDTGHEHGGDTLKKDVSSAEPVARRYDEAMAFPDVALEARLRAAWLAFRMGKLADAATYLRATPASSDRVLQYFRHLVGGQVLREQGQIDAAAQAFRDALNVWPGAQSARVGLMALLVQLGQRRDAEALAEAIQTDPMTSVDPWWIYWQGRYYAWGSIVNRLLEMRP